MTISGVTSSNRNIGIWDKYITDRNEKARIEMHIQLAEIMYRKCRARLQKEIMESLICLKLLGIDKQDKREIEEMLEFFMEDIIDDCLEALCEAIDGYDGESESSSDNKIFYNTEKDRELRQWLLYNRYLNSSGRFNKIDEDDIWNIINMAIGKLGLEINMRLANIEISTDINKDNRNNHRLGININNMTLNIDINEKIEHNKIMNTEKHMHDISDKIIQLINKRHKDKLNDLSILGIENPKFIIVSKSSRCESCGTIINNNKIALESESNCEQAHYCPKCTKEKLIEAFNAVSKLRFNSRIDQIYNSMSAGNIDPARLRVEMAITSNYQTFTNQTKSPGISSYVGLEQTKNIVNTLGTYINSPNSDKEAMMQDKIQKDKIESEILVMRMQLEKSIFRLQQSSQLGYLNTLGINL